MTGSNINEDGDDDDCFADGDDDDDDDDDDEKLLEAHELGDPSGSEITSLL